MLRPNINIFMAEFVLPKRHLRTVYSHTYYMDAIRSFPGEQQFTGHVSELIWPKCKSGCSDLCVIIFDYIYVYHEFSLDIFRTIRPVQGWTIMRIRVIYEHKISGNDNVKLTLQQTAEVWLLISRSLYCLWLLYFHKSTMPFLYICLFVFLSFFLFLWQSKSQKYRFLFPCHR